MKEVDESYKIEKAEFIYRNNFMSMEHNYLCGVCKEKPAVQDCNTGVLWPCWDCSKSWYVIKVNWLVKLLAKLGLIK